jgi:hypothetical protein
VSVLCHERDEKGAIDLKARERPQRQGHPRPWLLALLVAGWPLHRALAREAFILETLRGDH